jgi:hypothetical protein
VKTTKKLEIKKVTLQNLDEPKLDAVAGGITLVACSKVYTLCDVDTCGGQNTCYC